MTTGAHRQALWPLAILAALAIIPYLGLLGHPLVHDDRVLVRDNAWLASEANALDVFRHDFWHGTRVAGTDLYRPLTILSIAWGLQLGLGLWSVRLANLLLHALVVVQLARMLARSVPRSDGGSPARDGPPIAAWTGAAIFAIHPLASEAVIWINGRAELLAAFFGLLAFNGFLGLAGRRDVGGWRLTASALGFTAALFSKESALVWILIAATWYGLFRRQVVAAPRVMAVRSLVYLGPVALFALVRGAAVGWHRIPIPFPDNPLGHVDGATRTVNAVLLLGLYLRKAIWPEPLSIDWAFDQIPVRPVVSAWGGLALALAVAWISIALALKRRHRPAAFLFCFFFAAFAVTCNLLFPIGAIFGERLAYLPLAGLCGLAGVVLARFITARGALAAAIAAIVVAGGTRVAIRCHDFRSSAAIYEATVRACPRAVKSLATLGQIRLLVEHRTEEAIPLLERAVAIWPDYPRPWGLLAEAYRRLGRGDLAAACAGRAAEASAKLRAQEVGDALSPGQE